MTNLAEIIAANVQHVRAEIAMACARSGRQPKDVTLIGVTKSVDRPAIDALVAAGVTDIAENRVQDAVAKFGKRSPYPPLPGNVTLHMIGNAQTNKARDIANLFTDVHSLNRQGLADALQHEAARLGRRLRVFVEVNMSGEESKEGIGKDSVSDLLGYVSKHCPNLELVGLMTIGPNVSATEAIRASFIALREQRDELQDLYPALNLSMLSMGMSNDYPIAIEEGATHIRVGRALFVGLPSPR